MSDTNPLFIPPSPPFEDAAFSTDKLGRGPLAKTLTGYVQRLKFGAVIAIEAEWGEGKTWFALNWKKSLNDQGLNAIYIDAFEADYVDDPFSIIAGEIQSAIKSTKDRKTFVKKAASVAIAIAPALLSLAVRAGGKAVGISKLDEAIEGGADKILEYSDNSFSKLIENRIANYNEDKKSIAEFRTELTRFAGEQNSPLVIIIDELDRCKPEFAVKLLERVKHFFNVKNVVFVLFMNKRQLHNAIRGVYGSSTEAHLYLEKFLNFTFVLEAPSREHIRPFLEAELAKYDVPLNTQVDEYLACLCGLTLTFKLTTRQLEKAIGLLVLAHPFKTGGILLAELAALKLCQPELLEGLLKTDPPSIAKILDMFAQESSAVGRESQEALDFLIAVHRAQVEQGEGQHTLHLWQNYQFKKEKAKIDYKKFIKLLNFVQRE